MSVTHTIGRRKTSVARVFLQEGKGTITVNKKFEETRRGTLAELSTSCETHPPKGELVLCIGVKA